MNLQINLQAIELLRLKVWFNSDFQTYISDFKNVKYPVYLRNFVCQT